MCSRFLLLMIFQRSSIYNKIRPGETELGGVKAKIKVFIDSEQTYKEFNLLVDTMSSAFWLLSSNCNEASFPDCKGKQKLKPNKNVGTAELFYNNGNITGTIDLTTVNLHSVVLEKQTIFSIDFIQFAEFGVK